MTKATSTGLDDSTKDRIKALARGWKHPVERADVSAEYAAQEIVGDFCRPYLPAAEASQIRAFALRCLPRCRRS